MEIIKLKHISNFRDLGGIKTQDNRTIKKHMLIRGKAITKLSKHDIAKLKSGYGIKTMIDLRCTKELKEKPETKIKDVNYLWMPVSEEGILGISHEKRIHSFKSLYMMPQPVDLYRDLVSNECRTNIVNILKTILYLPEDQFSVVFHCTAGKDRTGIIAALLLSFLGVDRDKIIQDYLFTNKVFRFKANIAYIGLILAKGDLALSKKIRLSLLAKPEFINASLLTLETDFGSLDTFFKESLNISDEEKEMLRNKFLEN